MKQQENTAFSMEFYKIEKVFIDLDGEKLTDLLLSFDVAGTFLKKESAYELVFTTGIMSEGTQKNVVEVRCRTKFLFDGIKDKKSIPDFFYTNCIPIVFPFIRAYIKMATEQTNSQGITIPILNLMHLSEELKKNTKVK